MPNSDPADTSLRSSLIKGSSWMIGMRWSIRGIGLVSTIILVRLLEPDDFGLLAMSSLFISLLSVITSFGVDMALIQRPNVEDAHFNTAWTIRILQTGLVAFGVFALAPIAAAYFNEPRVTTLMRFLSIGIFLGGFENIGIVTFRKDLKFSKEYQFMVTTKIVNFVVIIVLAMWLRSYWALAWGMVFRRVIAVSLSYIMHPYRPSISFQKFSDLWSFSQWMLVRNIGMYIRRQFDSFLVARAFATDQVGFYSIAKEVSELPTTEVIWPLARALFPGYAKIAHDTERLGTAYRNVLSTISLITMPAGIGLALVANPLVIIAFGERWAPIVPVLSFLSIYGTLLTLSSSVQTPLIALGRMRRVAAVVWLQLVVTVPAIIYATSYGELQFIAIIQVVTSFVLMPFFFLAVTTSGIISWTQIALAIWRPLCASVLMAICIFCIPSEIYTGPLSELIIKVVFGGCIYVCATAILWILNKRPDGGERVVFELLVSRIPFLAKLVGD